MSAPLVSQSLLGGRFAVEREVGRGGVGIVYRASDQVTGQTVALKVIAIAGVDAGEEARFVREGRLLAGLKHPGIVRLVAFGQLEDGQPYVAMEWLDGEDLAQRQKRKPLTLPQALEVAAAVADALQASHDAGIVHRDVKPSNVFLLRGDEGTTPVAKLVDFGVASAEDAKLTRTGAIIGTPAYMAPEQARGDTEVDARADLYALGATLFEMVAGRPPHVGPTPIAILARLVTTPAPRLCEVLPDVVASLDDFVARLLATIPQERPSGGAEVARELRRIAKEVASSTDVARTAPDSAENLASMGEYGGSLTTSKNAGGTRMVTSILATQVPKGAPRQRLLAHLRSRGADATELGGDAIVAHLGARRALGDEAARAIDLAFRLAKTNAAVGIATGRTRVDRTRPTGEVVDRAAALSHTASRGQVLADTTTSELARGRYEFQIRSDGAAVVGAEVRGKRDQVGGAPFVGREAELGQVTAAFERCVDDKTPVITTVTGAPGIGKTRLRRESVSRIASHSSNPRLVIARCETFAKTHALGVVADIARGIVGLPKGAPLADALEATRVLVELTGVDIAPPQRELVARLIANEPLLIDDARATRDALWIALTDIAVGAAKQVPLAVVVEDAQWADVESLAWIDHVMGRGAGRPLFVLLTARPTLWRDDAKRFAGRDHVRIELRPLARKTVRAIARAMLGDRAVGDAGEQLTDFIATQAAGSPLFAEELARLAAKGQDATSAPTIEAAIQVHLDALEDAHRDAAIKLSVFGMVGWDAGLSAVGVPGAGEALRSLASSEILFEQASSRFKDTREWSFKHALMREVAYASLGEDALRTMHARAGHWLAKMGEDDATVARHLELGGESLVAAGYLEKAARRSLAANALAAAVSQAERALAFAEEKPEQFARAQLLDEAWNRLDARAGERATAVRAMEEAVYDRASDVRARGARVRYEDACGGGPETSARLDRVRKEAQAAGLADEEARSAAALASRYAFAGDLDEAAQVADGLLTIAQNHGIPGAAVDAWQTLAVVRQARGEVGAALEARRSAASAASAAGLKTREATITINVGFALTAVGAKSESRIAVETGLTLAQAIGSPGTVRHGQMILLCWSSTFGADSAHDSLLTEPRATADAAISGSWVPHDRATLGVLYYRGAELLRANANATASANAEHARTLLKTAAQGYRATKMLDLVPVALGLWAEAERRCGQPERARELATEAATMMDEGSPSTLNEAPVFLALHDACVDLGKLAEAKDAIGRGLPRLVTRVHGLVGTPYGRAFLTQLAPNAGLLAAAEAYGHVPAELRQVLDDAG